MAERTSRAQQFCQASLRLTLRQVSCSQPEQLKVHCIGKGAALWRANALSLLVQRLWLWHTFPVIADRSRVAVQHLSCGSCCPLIVPVGRIRWV